MIRSWNAFVAAAGGSLDCRVRANSLSLSVVNAQRCLLRSCAALRHDALRGLVALFRLEFAVALLLPLHCLVKELHDDWMVPPQLVTSPLLSSLFGIRHLRRHPCNNE